MKELFEIEPVLSPRLLWIRRHDLHTSFASDLGEPWSAWSGSLAQAIDLDNFGIGKTVDDALADWAEQNGVLLWNEEV